jgi:hypothetical protein
MSDGFFGPVAQFAQSVGHAFTSYVIPLPSLPVMTAPNDGAVFCEQLGKVDAMCVRQSFQRGKTEITFSPCFNLLVVFV